MNTFGEHYYYILSYIRGTELKVNLHTLVRIYIRKHVQTTIHD